jgi:uncharacterized protein (TIGR02246 family)
MNLFVLAVVVLAAAAPTPTPSAADIARAHTAEAQKAINAGNAFYISYWQKGLAHSFALLYTEDASSINGDGTATRGRVAIEAARVALMQQTHLETGEIVTEDLVVDGDLAYEMGRYSFVLKAPGQSPTTQVGRYLTIWQRQPDGKWLIKTDAGLTNRNCSTPQ